jgi:Flp pilus assembly protein TadG
VWGDSAKAISVPLFKGSLTFMRNRDLSTGDKENGATMNSQRGAAVVEFAFVLPLLLVILFGIIEFSFLLYDKAMLTNASREGARVGIV